MGSITCLHGFSPPDAPLGSCFIFSFLPPGLLAPGQKSWVNVYTEKIPKIPAIRRNSPSSVRATDHILSSVYSLLLNSIIKTQRKKNLCDLKQVLTFSGLYYLTYA